MQYTIKLLKKEEIAEGTLSITFERPKEFSFEAGHYVQLVLQKLKYPDPKGASRTFSLCSSPTNIQEVEIAFRKTESGYKKSLSELKVGSTVIVDGPLGHFVLPKDETRDIVCIAGGIGIAPFISMVRESVNTKSSRNITLLYANRSRETAAYHDELEEIAKMHSSISLLSVFGCITSRHVLPIIQKAKKGTFFLIVGPPAMVADMQHLLSSLGVSDESIRIEEFTGY